jgi:hypothetical protein
MSFLTSSAKEIKKFCWQYVMNFLFHDAVHLRWSPSMHKYMYSYGTVVHWPSSQIGISLVRTCMHVQCTFSAFPVGLGHRVYTHAAWVQIKTHLNRQADNRLVLWQHVAPAVCTVLMEGRYSRLPDRDSLSDVKKSPTTVLVRCHGNRPSEKRVKMVHGFLWNTCIHMCINWMSSFFKMCFENNSIFAST